MNGTTYTATAYTFDDLPDKDARATALGYIVRERETDEAGHYWTIETELEHGATADLWRSYGIEPHASGFVWSLFGQGSGAGPNELPVDDVRPLLRAAGIDLRTATARRLIELAEEGRVLTRTKDRTPFLTELTFDGRDDWPTGLGLTASFLDRLAEVLRDLNDRTERALVDASLGYTDEAAALEDARERGAVFTASGDLLDVELMEVKS